RIRTLKEDVPKGRTVTATSDIWTANTEVPYISLTAHWIETTTEQWTLKKATVGCEAFGGPHTATRFQQKLEHMADVVGIKGNIVTITADTSANIRKAINDWTGVGLIGCAAHVIERSVQNYVSRKELKATIDVFNKAATHFGCWTASQEHLGRAQKARGKRPKKVPISCKMRWWSYYYMLSALLEYRYEVMSTTEAANQRPKGPSINIRGADWHNVEEMCKMLGPFAEAVELIEGDRYVTLSDIPCLMEGPNAAILDASSSLPEDGALLHTGDYLFDDHSDRWEELNTPTKVAAMVDPRTNDGAWTETTEHNAHFELVKDACKDLVQRDYAVE
ncbi:unnamed protein product, partial [Discosporangium mesarthrocarpum]